MVKVRGSERRTQAPSLNNSLLQTTILSLKFLQKLGPVNFHATVILAPTVLGLLRDPEISTNSIELLPLRKPHFSLSQHPYDLFGGESLTCHPDLLPMSRFENTNSKPELF